MHLHLVLVALAAPFTLSLPQPVPQGETGALVPRHAPNSVTHGLEGERHKEKRSSEGPLTERTLIDRQSSGNSTREDGQHAGKKYSEKHHTSKYSSKEALRSGNATSILGSKYSSKESLTSGNYTSILGGKFSSKEALKTKNSTSILVGGEYQRKEALNSENSTSVHSSEHHGKGTHHREVDPPQFDKRIEEANGTAGGFTGKEKYRPDGHHADLPVHERPSL